MNVPDWIRNFGMTGERRAVALLCLGLLMAFYLFIGLNSLAAAPALAPYMLAMSVVYGIAFFSVGAEWFWARWFATGIAWSGVIEAAFGLLQILRMRDDFPPEVFQLFVAFFIILGSLHGLTGASLLGPKIAERYDARDDWRKRWQLDEQGALKVRRAVTRAATSLPMIIALALAPRQEQSLAMLAAFVLGSVGLAALICGRGAGVLAIGSAGALLIATGLLHALRFAMLDVGAATPLLPSSFVPMMPLIAGALLLAAFAPFARPVLAHVTRRPASPP